MLIPIESASVFSEQLDHPECVTVDARDGSLWAGGEAGQIYHIAPEGGPPELVTTTGGFILGLAVSPDGSWLAACDWKHACVWRWDITTRRLSEFARGPTIPN